MRPRKTIIVITPSESLRNQYALQMSVWGYRVLQPSSMDDALVMVKAEQPDAVLCDRMADGMIQQLAAAAPERTGFVLVTENGRKVKDFNAILRERLKNAANRKPGPKKDSASAGLRTSLLTGTVAVLALLVAVALVFASGFQQRNVLSVVEVKLARASAPTLQITNQVIGLRVSTFEQLPELLRGEQGPRPNREHRMPLGLGVGHAELFLAGLNVSCHTMHRTDLLLFAGDSSGFNLFGSRKTATDHGNDCVLPNGDVRFEVFHANAQGKLLAAYEADRAVVRSSAFNGFNGRDVVEVVAQFKKTHVVSSGLSLTPERAA